uniref:Uncharacterized protein n=1 Tax=Aegilops tauschii TaxID=37682 RepID=M8C6R1_AEGTA
MAAPAPGAGAVEVSMDDKAKALVAAKIKEGEYKVRMIGEYAVRTDRAIDALEKKVQDIEAEEKLYLHQIDDFATATIAEYEASVGPVPAFDNHLSLFSKDIPLEFPEPLAPPPASSASASSSASHHE